MAWGLLVAAGLLLLFATWAATSQRRRAVELATELIDLREASEREQKRASALASDLREAEETIEQQQDQLEADREALVDQVRHEAKQEAEARIEALWTLMRIDERRAWRLGTGGSTPPAGVVDDTLAEVLAMEVERIREEVGTPGQLEAVPEGELTADDAVMCLSATRELLRVLVPHTEAFELAVCRTGEQLSVEVLCADWAGPDTVADEVAQILAAVGPAGGDLKLTVTSNDRLKASLWLPIRGAWLDGRV